MKFVFYRIYQLICITIVYFKCKLCNCVSLVLIIKDMLYSSMKRVAILRKISQIVTLAELHNDHNTENRHNLGTKIKNKANK